MSLEQFEEVGQFTRMGFRFGQNLKENFACDQIFVAKFSYQRRIGFDLPPFEQEVFDDHFGQRGTLFRVNADNSSLSR